MSRISDPGRASTHGKIGLARHLSKRLLPITVVAGILIAVIFPLTYLILEHKRLDHTATIHAEAVAARFTSHLVLQAPVLWKYQTYRHTQVVEDLVRMQDVIHIIIRDENGKSIEGYEYVKPGLKWWQKHAIIGSAPIRFNNRDVGRAEVSISEGSILIQGAIVFTVSALAGTALGVGAYSFPVRLVRKMEGEIEQLIDSVQTAQEESERLRTVAEASAVELEMAYEELKASEAKIMQHEKLASIGHLAAGVAHEVNNPLAFISGNLGVLRQYGAWLREFYSLQEEALNRNGDDAYLQKLREEKERLNIDFVVSDLDQLVGQCLDGTDRVQKIVKELKGFSVMDEAEFKIVDINDCLDSTVRLVSTQLAKKAEIITDYGELPPTGCYPQQLSQVFLNLLINAAHAIEGRGTIKIRTLARERSIYIAITDSGCGIPQENLKKIFEPFFTTRESGKGTGLGLSISYDIVKKHDGDITVDTAIGRGSTFTVRIPVNSTAFL